MGDFRNFRALKLALFIVFGCNLALSDVIRQKQSEIKSIGTFVNIKSDGAHADGYSVSLWRQAKELLGLVDYHRGLLGDPPMGILTDIKYNASTGALSFKAKLTSGLHSCKEHVMVPSRELISFQGFLKKDKLQGRIILENQNDSSSVLVDSRDNLVMRKHPESPLEDYESYDAWWRHWEPVYKARGAKW